MAHELDTRENGAASFVSLRKTAWHQLGTIVADELSFGEAMHLGGLDYPLELRPLTTTRPIYDAAGSEIDSVELPVTTGHSAVVRSDRGTTLGVVGGRYRIVTNREAMGLVDVLVNENLAVIETAGALREGADAWMAIRFTGERIEAAGENGGDTIRYYGLVRTNHNGRASVQIATTPIRVVCANTLAMALNDRETSVHNIVHGTGAKGRVLAAAQAVWGRAATDAEQMAQAFETLRRKYISEAQFAAAVLDEIAPLPEAPKDDATSRSRAIHETNRTKAEEERMIVQRLWVSGTGQNGALTAWDALNAATEATDHFGTMGTRGERLTSLLPTGRVAKAKARVFTNLLALQA
jgi:phage/plasmid-like protein (TIGR03299 family)